MWNIFSNFFNHKIPAALGFIFFFFLFSFYLYYLCPSLYWRDPGEFAAIGYTLSVGHPTGSPTYSLIAKMFTFLPFGSIFQKINLVSAVFGALTVFLVFRLVFSVAGANESYFSRKPFWIFFSALAASLLLTVSPTFWLYSVVSKGYPQLTFWILIIISLLLHFRKEARKNSPDSTLSSQGQSLFFAAAFLFGLSLGTYGAMILYLPAFLGYCFLIERRWYRDPKILLLGVFFFTLGFSVYLYLPLRSSANPFLDWGEPRILSRFMNHLRDTKDTAHIASFSLVSMARLSWNSLKVLLDQFTVFGIGLGVIGIAGLFFKDRAFFWLTFGVSFIHWLFFVRFNEFAFLYIPLFVIFAIWIGLGILTLGKTIEILGKDQMRKGFRQGFAWALMGAVMATFLIQFLVSQPISGKRQYYVPYEVGKEMLLSLPPKTILFSNLSTMLFLGLQGVENLRPDVFVAVIPSLRDPRGFWSLDRAHYPAFDFERLPEVFRPNSIDFFTKVLDAHSKRVPLYWDLSPEDRWLIPRLVPDGLLYRIEEKEAPLLGEVGGRKLKELLGFYQFLFPFEGFRGDEEGRRFLKNIIAIRGIYYLHRGFIPSSLTCNRIAINLMENDANLYTNQGILLVAMGQPEEALKAWDRAITLNPLDPSPRINRGSFFYKKGDYTQSLREWEEAIRLGGQGILAHYYRAIALREMGKPKDAFLDLQAFLSKSARLAGYFGDDPFFTHAQKLVQGISDEIPSKGIAGK